MRFDLNISYHCGIENTTLPSFITKWVRRFVPVPDNVVLLSSTYSNVRICSDPRKPSINKVALALTRRTVLP